MIVVGIIIPKQKGLRSPFMSALCQPFLAGAAFLVIAFLAGTFLTGALCIAAFATGFAGALAGAVAAKAVVMENAEMRATATAVVFIDIVIFSLISR